MVRQKLKPSLAKAGIPGKTKNGEIIRNENIRINTSKNMVKLAISNTSHTSQEPIGATPTLPSPLIGGGLGTMPGPIPSRARADGFPPPS